MSTTDNINSLVLMLGESDWGKESSNASSSSIFILTGAFLVDWRLLRSWLM